MTHTRCLHVAATILILAMTIASAQARPFDKVSVPDSLGINIHFTTPQPGEMQMLADSGAKWVRMDFLWGDIETKKGVYDFTQWDTLIAALNQYHIKAILILDYTNPLYDGNHHPQSPEAVNAFAAWAAAAAVHFKGNGIAWEMWNEPNGDFPPDAYSRLALAVGKAIKTATPHELYVGPAESGMDPSYMEACLKSGILQYWDAVTVHPYRGGGPESVLPDYDAIRKLIAQYAPKGKSVPLLSGEWGYTSAAVGVDDQGKLLAREWLVNLAAGIPLSIWYDWHDDGPDPNNGEHHFGTTYLAYYDGRIPVYDPKPAYLAAQTLTSTLNGYSPTGRLPVGNANDFVVQFRRRHEIRLAAWTTSTTPHAIVLPLGEGDYTVVDCLGHSRASVHADTSGLTIRVSDSPVYVCRNR